MTDTKNAWMESWLKAQQSYWKSWADLARFGDKAPAMPKSPWAEGLDQWWQALSPLAPPDGRAVFDKLMDMAKGYFGLAERFVADRADKNDPMEVLNGWLEAMRQSWSAWRPGTAPLTAGNPLKDMMAFWDLPMDTWNRMAANIMPMPGDFTQAFHPEGAAPGMGALHEQMNRFLSIPAVGYTREAQEQQQRLSQLAMDYAAATQAYQMAFAKLALETTQKFQRAMLQEAENGKPVGSLREVYDRWVELAEAAYAEFVMTDEYRALYGRLVNSLLALKAQMARLVDEGLETLHMPTHAEISTLQRRQQELRRENLRLNKTLKGMQEQLTALLAQAPQTPPPGKSARPAAKAIVKPAVKRAAAQKVATRPASAASKSKSGGNKK